MLKTQFFISKMDCPSEEKILRMALENFEGIKNLTFDTTTRKMEIVHDLSDVKLLEKVLAVGFGGEIFQSRVIETYQENEISKENDLAEAKVLKVLLGINFAMF